MHKDKQPILPLASYDHALATLILFVEIMMGILEISIL